MPVKKKYKESLNSRECWAGKIHGVKLCMKTKNELSHWEKCSDTLKGPKLKGTQA
jgi:hypothetical protein